MVPIPINWPSDFHALQTRVGEETVRRFTIDTRSLAASRIALGLLVLADIPLRSRTLHAFSTDSSVLLRSALISQANPLHWSLQIIFGGVMGQALLFLIAGVFAVALTLGYRTKIATIGSWLSPVSLHNRMPDVLNGGDFLLRLLLFRAMFLPCGTCWAVDRFHEQRPHARTAITSVATVAPLL